MKKCNKCKQVGTIKQVNMDVTHTIFKQEISIKEVPVLVCDCGFKDYAHPESLDFQIRDAYRAGINQITFKL